MRGSEGDLFSVEHLYDYLVAVFGDALLAGRDGKRWAEAFNVEAQHPDLSSLELRILRSIAMLGIVGRWNGIAPHAGDLTIRPLASRGHQRIHARHQVTPGEIGDRLPPVQRHLQLVGRQ